MEKAIYSMTGFAARKSLVGTTEISAEVRSLNSRYLEMYVKLPPLFREQEDAVKELIRQKVDRGKINCTITLHAKEDSLDTLQVNESAVKNYTQLLNDVRRVASIEKPLELSDFLQFKDLFVAKEDDEMGELLRNNMQLLLADTLDGLNETRSREGANLKKDLLGRLDAIATLNAEITDLGKDNARTEFNKLHKRLLSMIEEQKIDRNRLEMELALISDRVDISEEVVRMTSHLDQFKTNLSKGSPIGKKLNFILQEMHREANTISSKSSLIEISKRIVTVKEEIERMREQVQNIE
ncbi:MAG: YicC/YloC family endoribonuclease [Calditrichota bacterium]